MLETVKDIHGVPQNSHGVPQVVKGVNGVPRNPTESETHIETHVGLDQGSSKKLHEG